MMKNNRLFVCRFARGAGVATLALFLQACGGGNGSQGAAPAPSPSPAQPPIQALHATDTPTSPTPSLTIVANAGKSQVAAPRTVVTLAGSGSASLPDASQPAVSYSWKQVDGPVVDLSNQQSAHPMFKIPALTATAVMTFALTVSAMDASASDQVRVVVDVDSPWGVAPSATLSNYPEAWVPSMVDAGVVSVRSLYAPVTSGPDRFAAISAAGMSGAGILKWSPGTTSNLPVGDLAGWRDYVVSQVTRYKGRIRHWEVWNEPPNFTADKSPASYARIVAVAYDAAKSVDPDVRIGLAAKSNHVNFLAETIAAGARDKFDFVTLHPYEVASMLPAGFEGAFMGIVPRIRQMLRASNPEKAAAPVWFTEVGIPASTTAPGGVGPDIQADVLTKIYTLSLAQGVSRVYWFDPRDSEGLSLGLTTADGSRRPSWYAMRSLSTHLGAKPRYAGWMQSDDAYQGFVFRSDAGVAMVAWAGIGQSATRPLASEVSAIDPRTGAVRSTRQASITAAPVILVAPADSEQARQWLAAASESAGKAFRWNGDHSASTSVELVAGATPDGVFMLNPPPVKVVDDIAEFDATGRRTLNFAVDPTFLSYATTPIRITALVRGHGDGTPGFNLKYESDAPIASADSNGLVNSSAGWFQVKGTSFYEKTWTLPNARFVGMYGYNFSFDSDSTSRSQYSIARVTVSR